MPHFKSLPCAATNANPQMVSSYQHSGANNEIPCWGMRKNQALPDDETLLNPSCGDTIFLVSPQLVW